MDDTTGSQRVPPPVPRAGRRERLALTVLALPTLLVAFDIGGLQLALPKLSADLHPSTAQQLWITDVYGLLLAGSLITMGNLGDRIGRRRLLLIGAVLFAVASVVAAFSSSALMLIVCRGALGVAGATLMPSTLALVGDIFQDRRERGQAVATIYTCLMTGSALGPVVGGLLLEKFWWGSVFLLGVPFMALLLLAGPLLLPESKDARGGGIDLLSVVLSLLCLMPLVFGIKELFVGGLSSPVPSIAAIVVGVACGVAFILRQRTLEVPLLDLGLVGDRAVGVLLAAMLIGGAAMAGIGLLISQYLQTVLALSPARAGLLFAPIGLGVALGTMLTPRLAGRLRTSTAIAGGLLVSAVGFVLTALIHEKAGQTLAVAGIVVIAVGVGPLLALGVGIVLGSAPPERAGAAASLSETSNNLGPTLGMATLGTIALALYRSHLGSAMPAGVPANTARAAQETVAGAANAAASLPAGVARRLLGAADGAYTRGVDVAGIVGALTFALLAALVAASARQIDAAGGRAAAEAGTDPAEAEPVAAS